MLLIPTNFNNESNLRRYSQADFVHSDMVLSKPDNALSTALLNLEVLGENKISFKDRFKNLGPTADHCGFSDAISSNYRLHYLCRDGCSVSQI